MNRKIVEAQKDLIKRLESEIGALADYLFPDNDSTVNNAFADIEFLLGKLKDTYLDKNTYIKLRERETGEITMRYFEKGAVDALCYKAAQFYAWSDCDDTYEIVEIVCDGHELRYVGWQPDMLYEFKDLTDGRIVYSAEFPEWDH